jgi:prepilin-type N-terminal cleavage/methylation domain-containing protein
MYRNSSNKNKSLGYTLIELLLVIAIISIITALGIFAYRRYFFTQRVEKVALEMQYVLEAAMAYNVDQGSWPVSNNATPNCELANPNSEDRFVKDYMPQGRQDATMTALGNHYCWGAAQSSSFGAVAHHAQRFWLAVSIPGGDAKLAARIAARLPNGIVTSQPNSDASPAPSCAAGQPCYVRSEVMQPSQTSNQASGSNIVSTGQCRTGSGDLKDNSNDGGGCANASDLTAQSSGEENEFDVTFKSCSSGTPDVVVLPDFHQVPNGKSAWGANIVGQSVRKVSCSNTSEAEGMGSCEVTETMMVCKGSPMHGCTDNKEVVKDLGGQEGLSYIVMCLAEE